MTDENQDMSPEEEASPENAEESFGDEPIIPEEDFREAIDKYDEDKVRGLIDEANRIKKIIR